MASKENFDPRRLTVRQLLTDSYNFYDIPEYQRPYKWKEEQINDLIKDVKDSMDMGEYFIGTMILIEKGDGFDVIDGQQRLTTLTLILAAYYRKYGSPELKKCFIDEDQGRYRIKVSPRVDQRNDFQVGFLSKILEGQEPDNHGENIFSGYYSVTKDLLSKNDVFDDPEDAMNFYRYLLDHVYLITITTGSEGFAVRLFYVMNARGASLSNDEVIKVLLYDKLDERGRETFMGSWRNIESQRKQLKQYWEEYNNLEKIFNLYSYYYLGEKPRTIVYDTYAKMLDKGVKPLVIIDKVKQFADSLLKLHGEHGPGDSLIEDNSALQPFYYLYDSVYWQVLLGAAIDVGYVGFRELVQELFRLYYLNWISGHNTGNIRDISMKILKQIKGKEGISKIISLIEKKIREENLEKTAFENLEKDVYSEKPKNWLHAVLCLLEYNLYDESGTDYIEPYGKKAPSIDHILPKGWQEVYYWTEKWTVPDANEWIYKLGNMTLVSMPKNDAMGNLDFLSKRRHYSGTIGDAKATRYKLNDTIVGLSDWNLTNLKQRQAQMISSLKEILKPA